MTSAAEPGTPQPGAPPIRFSFGLQSDPETVALTRAAALYNANHRNAAKRIFSRFHDLDAEIGIAFADWPKTTVARLQRLAASHPRRALVLLHLGLAEYWLGHDSQAVTAWRGAETAQPDSPYALAAASLLHPNMPPLPLPQFTTDVQLPRQVRGLRLPQQVASLRLLASHGNVTALLYYGVALQELGHRVSAEREFVRASALAPNSSQARTAAAVGAFTKANPAPALSALQRLLGRFPRAAVVRFHLGYLLIWVGKKQAAARQLRLAETDQPYSVYARSAKRLLLSLRG